MLKRRLPTSIVRTLSFPANDTKVCPEGGSVVFRPKSAGCDSRILETTFFDAGETKGHQEAIGMHRDFVLFVIGHLLVHSVVLLSVFDLYFSSTVVRNVQPLEWCSHPSADRIVLFVADGLRADKFFELDEKNKPRAPYLMNIIRQNGSWGVSHTHAPTESRPCHVAMLGGFWEDPNGLKVGWKYNPVEFDTIFNESRETWSWGADDVLPYFNKGSAAGRVHLDTHHYREAHLSNLDVWTFDRVKSFLSNAKKDKLLREKLFKDRIVFFLHLAGIDSNGHRHHPGSSSYLENIRVVDKGIKETVAAFNEFYKYDKKTAFIFTGDHGMTDKGGHGGDHPRELETPFVAWGSGVSHKRRTKQTASSLTWSEIASTRKWDLDPSTRKDISQIDISMLMAALIGVPYPVNSVGKTPIDYLASDEDTIAAQVYGRTKQMAEAFLRKRYIVENAEFHLLFWEYAKGEKVTVQEKKHDIEQLIDDGHYEQAVSESHQLFEFVSKGFSYYQTYQTSYIFTSVMVSVVGWMILCISFVLLEKGLIRESSAPKPVKNVKFALIFVVFYVALALRIYQFDACWRYYLYAFMPVFVWYLIMVQFQNVCSAFQLLCKQFSLSMLVALLMFGAWACIISFGFYQRYGFSICCGILALIPGLYTLPRNNTMQRRILWMTLCICLLAFPLLSEVVKGDTKKEIVLLGGVLASFLCASMKIYHSLSHESSNTPKTKQLCHLLNVIAVFLPTLTGLVGYSRSHTAVRFGKVILALSWIAPFFSSSNLFQRLLTFNVWQLSAYVLVSVSYDIPFYAIFTALLHMWVIMETGHSRETELDPLPTDRDGKTSVEMQPMESFFHDIRRASIMLFFLSIGFFGIYSVESMNHFHVRVLPFLPVTNTFALLFLFVYKLCLHYLTIGVTFCTLSELMQLPLKLNWYITACVSDVMLIHFYHAVRNSGSWAQIGFSLANLGIVAGLPIGLLLIFAIGKVVVTVKVPEPIRIF